MFTTILTIATIFSTIHLQSDETQQMMCQCWYESNVSSDTLYRKKEIYTYIVTGKDGRDCCNKPPSNEYTGFYEVWFNEAPDHPNVWAKDMDSLKEMDPVKAQERGCNAEGRLIHVIYASDFADKVHAYYPELDK